jgi:rod shape-determining protein MreC
MQNFFLFLRKYYHLFLFIILELIALTALVKFNHYQNAVFYSTANEVSGYLYQKKSDALSYLSLKEENKRLLNNTAVFMNDSLDNHFMMFGTDSFLMNDTMKRPWFSFYAAEVINNTVHRKRNYLTINKGFAHGIEKHMGVISQDGVVGIVIDVSKNFALVMSVLHDQFQVSPEIAGSNYFGKLKWDGMDPRMANIDEISRYYPVEKGQRVVTSNFGSTKFPRNIPIGIVESVKKSTKKPFATIRVKLATDFGRVRSVYVIKNIFKQELQQLEERVEDE